MTNKEAAEIIKEIFCEEPELKEAYALAVKALEDDWIFPNERLPENIEDVLTLISGKDGIRSNVTFVHAYAIGSFDKDGGWLWDEYPEAEFTVEAWRPLPKSYLEDEE